MKISNPRRAVQTGEPRIVLNVRVGDVSEYTLKRDENDVGPLLSIIGSTP